MRAIAALAIALLLALPCVAQKKPRIRGPIAPTVVDNLLVEAPNVELVTAKEKCRNWQWAAAVETILRYRGVPLDQSQWIERADGNACLDDESAISREHIGKAVRGVYVLDDGSRVRVEAIIPVSPLATDAILPALRDAHPLLLLTRDATYVLEAVVFDVWLYPANQREFSGKQLWVVDLANGERKKLEMNAELTSTVIGVMDFKVEQVPAGTQ